MCTAFVLIDVTTCMHCVTGLVSGNGQLICCSANTGVPIGELPEEHRRETGKRCHHLHAHDPRAARCHGDHPCILFVAA